MCSVRPDAMRNLNQPRLRVGRTRRRSGSMSLVVRNARVFQCHDTQHWLFAIDNVVDMRRGLAGGPQLHSEAWRAVLGSRRYDVRWSGSAVCPGTGNLHIEYWEHSGTRARSLAVPCNLRAQHLEVRVPCARTESQRPRRRAPMVL